MTTHNRKRRFNSTKIEKIHEKQKAIQSNGNECSCPSRKSSHWWPLKSTTRSGAFSRKIVKITQQSHQIETLDLSRRRAKLQRRKEQQVLRNKPEGDLGERSTTARVVDDVLHDTLEVAVALGVVQRAQLGSTLAVEGVRLHRNEKTVRIAQQALHQLMYGRKRRQILPETQQSSTYPENVAATLTLCCFTQIKQKR